MLKTVDIILFLYIDFDYDEELILGVSYRFKTGNTQIVFPPATCSFGFSMFFVHGLRRDSSLMEGTCHLVGPGLFSKLLQNVHSIL